MLIQHGYGKGLKLQLSADLGRTDGVIFSPRDESPLGLALASTDILGRGLISALDPQIYAAALPSPKRDGHLPEYEFYSAADPLDRRRLLLRRTVDDLVQGVLQYQVEHGFSEVIAPTICLERLDGGADHTLALSMFASAAELSAENPGWPPMRFSLVIDERAFEDMSGVDEMLDMVTGLVWPGRLYLIVKRNSATYPGLPTVEFLHGWLHFIDVLSNLNDWDVWLGYSDFLGLSGVAAGASQLCTGWFNGLREFSLRRFEPSTGGARPRPRIASHRLMNSVLLSEVESMQRANQLEELGSRAHWPEGRGGDVAGWEMTASEAFLQHVGVLDSLERQVKQFAGRDRILEHRRLLEAAAAAYERLGEGGIAVFSPNTSVAFIRRQLEALDRLTAS